MSLDIDYYFENIRNDEMFHKVTNGINNVLNIFSLSNKIIDEIENSGKQQIYTDDIDENVIIKGNVIIEKGTKIKAGCIIQGPIYIGKDCELMYNSYVRPGTILGNNCVIGFCTEVKHTIMRDGSKISDLAFVGDSIIGSNSRIGSGVIVANRGFNQSNIIAKDENRNQIDLQRESFGVVLGDNSRIGSNCTTQPGTFIGKFTWIYPHTCIHGFIPMQKKVYDKQNMTFEENEMKTLNKSTDWDYGNYK